MLKYQSPLFSTTGGLDMYEKKWRQMSDDEARAALLMICHRSRSDSDVRREITALGYLHADSVSIQSTYTDPPRHAYQVQKLTCWAPSGGVLEVVLP